MNSDEDADADDGADCGGSGDDDDSDNDTDMMMMSMLMIIYYVHTMYLLCLLDSEGCAAIVFCMFQLILSHDNQLCALTIVKILYMQS